MAGNKLKVHIYDTETDFRIHPTLVEADADGGTAVPVPDKLVIKNHTKEDLVLYAPAGVFKLQQYAEPIAADGKLEVAVKSQGNGNSKMYKFVIYSPTTGKRVKANSDPVIIIDN